MIATGYILVSVQAGQTKKVYQQLAHTEGVVSVDAISGPYDIIATVQASDFTAIGRLVLEKIRPIDGITNTITCNVISFEV